jgi:hypothetical protein
MRAANGVLMGRRRRPNLPRDGQRALTDFIRI